MAPEHPSTSRLCARCRQPLVDGPDRAARGGFDSLYCTSCAAALSAAVQRLRKANQPAAPAGNGPSSAANPTPVHAQAKIVTSEKPEPPPIPLADDVLLVPESSGPAALRVIHTPTSEPAGPDLGVSPPDPTVKIETRVCLNCSHTVTAGNPVCAYCQYDARKGLPKKLAAEVPLMKCRKCGYDLTGLQKPICPECGSKVSLNVRSSALRRSSQETAKWAYLRPCIMLGVGLAGTFLFELISNGWNIRYPLFFLIEFAINVPIMVAAYLACAVAWLGFDMPIHLIALRLAAVRAVVILMMAILLWLVPVPIVGWGLSYITYVWLLHTELDIELQDAVILAVLTFGVQVLIFMVVIAKIGSALGII